jgi:hypothetical protein
MARCESPIGYYMQVHGKRCILYPLWCLCSCLYLNQVSSLDDVKSSSQTDNNAAKTIALDHLGVIAARIRSSMLKVKQGADGDAFVGLKPLDDVISPSLRPSHVLIFI